MAVAYQRGQRLTKDDLFVQVYQGSNLVRPNQIYYNLYDKTSGTPILIAPLDRPVEEHSVGLYYAPWVIPPNANFGEYEVRFSWQVVDGGPFTQEVTRFQVVGNFSILNNESYKQLIQNASSGVTCGDNRRIFLSGNIVYIVLGEGSNLPCSPFYF